MAKEKTEAAGEDSSLIPPGKVPKGIDSLARSMKIAELTRKHNGEIETAKREELSLLMEKEGINRFQIDIDGSDYEFIRATSAKVTSKKLREDD